MTRHARTTLCVRHASWWAPYLTVSQMREPALTPFPQVWRMVQQANALRVQEANGLIPSLSANIVPRNSSTLLLIWQGHVTLDEIPSPGEWISMYKSGGEQVIE